MVLKSSNDTVLGIGSLFKVQLSCSKNRTISVLVILMLAKIVGRNF